MAESLKDYSKQALNGELGKEIQEAYKMFQEDVDFQRDVVAKLIIDKYLELKNGDSRS